MYNWPMMRRFLKSQSGQTAVEYILLIVVAVSMGLLFMKKMDQYLIKNPNGLIGGPLNKFRESLGTPENRYRTYPLGPRAK